MRGVGGGVPAATGCCDNTGPRCSRTEIHADTQGQSLPVFGLAWLLGFELLPRIRNWQDLVFYRPVHVPTGTQHIDTLFADDAVDWQLIETHWPDLMRVVLSMRAGRISSVALLRRLGNESRRNRIYRAFRELGRAVRTIVLLRYLSEPELREGITAVTNRVEAFHGFARWLMLRRRACWPTTTPTTRRRSSSSTSCWPTARSTAPPWTIRRPSTTCAAEGSRSTRTTWPPSAPTSPAAIRRFGDWVLDLTPPPAVPAALDLAVVP